MSNPCQINWSNPAEIFTKGLSCLWQGVTSLPQQIVSGIQGAIGNVWSTISNIGQNIWNGLMSIGNAIQDVFNRIAKSIADIGGWIWQSVQSLGMWLWGIVQQVFSAIQGAMSWIWDQLVAFFNSSVKWILDRLGDIHRTISGVFEEAKNSVLNWINDAIINPVKSFFIGLYESIRKHVVETVIHNLPTVLVSFSIGELLYRFPQLMSQSPTKAASALITVPIMSSIGGAMISQLLKSGGVIGGTQKPITPRTYREVKKTEEALSENITLSTSQSIEINVYLVKEMTESIQGLGKARIQQLQVRRPAIEYDVGLSVSATIARAQTISTGAVILSSISGSVQAIQMLTITASRSISANVSCTIARSTLITASRDISASASGSISARKTVNVTVTSSYTLNAYTGVMVPIATRSKTVPGLFSAQQ